MKKLIIGMFFSSMLVFLCANSDAGIVEQVKKESDPFVGRMDIKRVSLMGFAKRPEDPYFLRFIIEFSGPVRKNKVKAYWSAEGQEGKRLDGIDVYALDDLGKDIGCVYLVTLNSALFRKLPKKFENPVDLTIGCEHPVSESHPSELITVYIRVNNGIPGEEWLHYHEGVPLVMILESRPGELQEVSNGTYYLKKKK